ncbi:MAG: trypsin-like peptidase domain-containing protein [Chloroflexi bacterium]|nr:trypsin-like peptidase domain-containing protein [Chloroflexota bacterium]
MRPSVVMVRADFPATAVSQPGEGSGTGIVFTSDGYILTNAHVVEGAGAITVAAAGSTRERPARFVGISACDDLAVIKVDDTQGLKPATFGKSGGVKEGQEVAAIGYPLGDSLGTDPSITRGIVSKTDVQLPPYENLIQTDASINPGNSGGPLVDRRGHVIGINTLKINPQMATNLDFAISIDQAKPVVSKLQEGHNLLWIGMNLTDNVYAKYFGTQNGVVVEATDSGGPAAHVGVQPAELLLQLAGLTISSKADVCKILRSHSIGDSLRVAVLRVGQTSKQLLEGSVVIGKPDAGKPLQIVRTLGASSSQSATRTEATTSAATTSAQTTQGGNGNMKTATYDFQSNNGDWFTGDNASEGVTLGGGVYKVIIKKPKLHGVYIPKSMPSGTDQAIGTTVLVTGTNGIAGVVTRFVNSKGSWSFYFCGITSDGRYSCWAVLSGKYTPIVQWTPSQAVKTGQPNQLVMITEGNKIAFSVNGTKLVSMTDTHLANGYPGLYVESSDQAPITATFGKTIAQVVQ